MPSLDWSRYRAVSGQADEIDAARLCESRDPVDRAMGEHLARGYEDFCPPVYDFPLSWWELALVRIGIVGLLAWVVGTVIVVAWFLMAYVLPAIPRIAAEAIRTGGMIVAGWM